MSVQVDMNNFLRYFTVLTPELSVDILNAGFLFASGVRPVEFLYLGVGNLDIDYYFLQFQQAKESNIAKRNLDQALIIDIKNLWSSVGNPSTYYGSYSSLKNYMKRSVAPKFQVTDRLDELYMFRYACCASLQYQGCTETEIDVFFQHINSTNTKLYKDKGTAINLQL